MSAHTSPAEHVLPTLAPCRGRPSRPHRVLTGRRPHVARTGADHALDRRPETTTTTAPAPATTTTVVRSTTTARPAPTTTVRPGVVDGVPQVTATPARAAVGARVRIEGTGFTEQRWRSGGTLWLTRTGSCALYAEAEHTITVSAAGRLTGDFVVPSSGNCRMDTMEAPVTAGSYRIAFACTACFIGAVEVTSSARSCANVGFTPNSDDVASSVVAVNLTCTEAEALVRKVGAQVAAVGGPARVTADGFTCVRTKQDDGAMGLPSATFECTSGTRTVSFVRT